MTGVGHNRTRVGGVAVDQLRGILERVERLEEEKAAIGADIRDVFAEAKSNGYDLKAIRSILKIRKMEAHERDEQEAVLDTYLRALGMIPQLDFDFTSEENASDARVEAGDDEVLYAQAVSLVVRDFKASTSYVQRCLGIGYNRAAELIERMEQDGIVGPANHVGKRDVLGTPLERSLSSSTSHET